MKAERAVFPRPAGRREGGEGGREREGHPRSRGGVSHDVRLEAGAMASRGNQGRPASEGRPGMIEPGMIEPGVINPGMISHVAVDGGA